MSEGIVYILRNKFMHGLVKIGKTTRTVEQRMIELNQTGVPTPFEVVDEFFTMGHLTGEEIKHALDRYRAHIEAVKLRCNLPQELNHEAPELIQ